MTPAFFARAEVLTVPDDPDQACEAVVLRMTQHIRQSADDPGFQSFARAAIRQYRGGPLFAATGCDPLADPGAIAESCWWFVRTKMKFIHHSKLMHWWLNKQDGYQLLTSPLVVVASLASPDPTIRDRGRTGDCAIYSMMLAAMLEAVGVQAELVTLAVDPEQPEVFSHVFVYAVLPDGRRLPLDASHGKYPGWQVPARDGSRRQVWSDDGAAVADFGPRFTGLGRYTTRRGSGLRGFGDVTSIDGTVVTDPSASTPDPGMQFIVDPTTGITYQTPITSSSATVYGTASSPASGNTQMNNLLANIATQWTKIAGNILAPTTTYTVGPNGQVSYSTPGSAAIPGSLTTSSGALNLTNLLPWALGAGLVIFAMSAMGGKR